MPRTHPGSTLSLAHTLGQVQRAASTPPRLLRDPVPRLLPAICTWYRHCEPPHYCTAATALDDEQLVENGAQLRRILSVFSAPFMCCKQAQEDTKSTGASDEAVSLSTRGHGVGGHNAHPGVGHLQTGHGAAGRAGRHGTLEGAALAQSRGETCHKQSHLPSQTPACFRPGSASPLPLPPPRPASSSRPARPEVSRTASDKILLRPRKHTAVAGSQAPGG